MCRAGRQESLYAVSSDAFFSLGSFHVEFKDVEAEYMEGRAELCWGLYTRMSDARLQNRLLPEAMLILFLLCPFLNPLGGSELCLPENCEEELPTQIPDCYGACNLGTRGKWRQENGEFKIILNYRKKSEASLGYKILGLGAEGAGDSEGTGTVQSSAWMMIAVFLRKKRILIHENIKMPFVVNASLFAHDLPLWSRHITLFALDIFISNSFKPISICECNLCKNKG